MIMFLLQREYFRSPWMTDPLNDNPGSIKVELFLVSVSYCHYLKHSSLQFVSCYGKIVANVLFPASVDIF
jgi:hypothetical protein